METTDSSPQPVSIINEIERTGFVAEAETMIARGNALMAEWLRHREKCQAGCEPLWEGAEVERFGNLDDSIPLSSDMLEADMCLTAGRMVEGIYAAARSYSRFSLDFYNIIRKQEGLPPLPF